MSVSFRILPQHGIVYIRYEGFALFDDTIRAVGAYTQHPESSPGQKHLVDLSRITGIEQDFVKLMQIQALKADAFIGGGAQTMIVYYAPTPLAFEVSKVILRSWDGIDAVVPLVQQSETGTLSLLGVGLPSFAALLEGTD
ncbi:hypothetical protein [Salipiger abyssi]|uniref:Uncharacterized protein n=1 Tax=Salipiger abyssi TaxID=1250539 RepID=A0A1P8UYC7_9RHOB|nr:hypothetical protein [Salipiger abyssi]APZ54404.1 hypothetical protein Ga0080574_TMP4070 [Salipiger abyssi]MBN9889009.1 hypothetical protein [Salipiger abyssi]